MVDEVEGEAAFDAQVAFVRHVGWVRGDLDDSLRLRVDIEVDLTADAAEGAGRLHFLERALGSLGCLLELLEDGARRADAEAATAELTFCVEPGVPVSRHDTRVRPAAFQGERRALHDLLRVADAAVAEDAGIGVVA